MSFTERDANHINPLCSQLCLVPSYLGAWICLFQLIIMVIIIIIIITLGRLRRRWEDNIRMDLEEIGINATN